MVNDVSASSGVSSPYKAVNSIPKNLLDGALCKILFISTFSLFFRFSNVILSDALILTASQLQTQQVMASQIKSHI